MVLACTVHLEGDPASGMGVLILAAIFGIPLLMHYLAMRGVRRLLGPFMGGAQMISMTGREAASAMFEHIGREISPTSPDLKRLVAISAGHQSMIHVPS